MKFLTVATCLLSAVLAAPTPYGSVPDEKSPYPVPEGGEYSNPPYVPPVDTNPTYPTPPNGNGEGNGDGYGNGDDGSYGNGNGNGNGNGGGYGNGGGNGGHGNGSGNGGHGNGSGNGGGHGNGGGNGDGGEPLCPSGLLYSNPQCCSTDVLGVADLDCATRKFAFLVPRNPYSRSLLKQRHISFLHP